MLLLCAFATPSSILLPSHCHFNHNNSYDDSNQNKIKAPPIFLPHHSSSRSIDSGCTLTRPKGRANASSSPPPLRQTSANGNGSSPEEQGLLPSAAAVAAAIRRASSSPVEIVQRIARDGKDGVVLPSADFRRLCIEQLDLFRAIVDPGALLSVYVRPADSYVMDRLELRRVTCYPGMDTGETIDEIVILIGNFVMPTGLRAAETGLSNNPVQVVPECRAVVFPMVKHPFVVGFLVAELPTVEFETCSNAQDDGQKIPVRPPLDESYRIPTTSDRNMWEIQAFKEDLMKTYQHFSIEQRSRAIKISSSLAVAYVMDQKAMLLQQSSWQNNVRMSNLVEQIRGPLSSIRTLCTMLSVLLKKTEISFDIVEDMLVQGDQIRDTLQQLQDAVHLTKANIMRYNEETLKKMHDSSSYLLENSSREKKNKNGQEVDAVLSLGSEKKDLQMPMPPLALAALQKFNGRPCNVSDVLADLIGAAGPLALKQKRSLKHCDFLQPLQIAVEESALRQALSNLIEGALLRTHVGGKVEIVSTGAPAGGALVVIDDDGPDMHYMTQMHSLTPFGVNLFTDGMVEDNMTWNFVAGLTVAREILESYGCVVRVISPRSADAALGAGGTRIELWLPAFPSTPTDQTPEG